MSLRYGVIVLEFVQPPSPKFSTEPLRGEWWGWGGKMATPGAAWGLRSALVFFVLEAAFVGRLLVWRIYAISPLALW